MSVSVDGRSRATLELIRRLAHAPDAHRREPGTAGWPGQAERDEQARVEEVGHGGDRVLVESKHLDGERSPF